jgi:glucosylglycerate synthase
LIVELDSIAEQNEHAEPVDRADLVIGILSDLSQDALLQVGDVIQKLPGAPRVVVLQSGEVAKAVQASGESPNKASGVSLIAWPNGGADAGGTRVQSISAAYQYAFSISKKLGARGCCVVASQAEADTPRWVNELTQPLLESDCDLVVPHYARGKFQGLLGTSVISPLMRSLYGKRIQNPLGPDLALSERLYLKILGSDERAKLEGSLTHLLASATPTAVCDNLQIREVNLGIRLSPPTDWTNTSTILFQALSPVFLEMERRAICWQRTRGSVSVPTVAANLSLAAEPTTIDTSRMVESFQLGMRDLQEIWGLVLPPATLLELRKLSRSAPEQFHMTDEIWARIVYDFTLAHRLRTINRDHLLRSMTPLYLAWVASFALDVKTAGGAMVDQRLEKLALAFETGKPYLVSRWRWPDRFNP